MWERESQVDGEWKQQEATTKLKKQKNRSAPPKTSCAAAAIYTQSYVIERWAHIYISHPHGLWLEWGFAYEKQRNRWGATSSACRRWMCSMLTVQYTVRTCRTYPSHARAPTSGPVYARVCSSHIYIFVFCGHIWCPCQCTWVSSRARANAIGLSLLHGVLHVLSWSLYAAHKQT